MGDPPSMDIIYGKETRCIDLGNALLTSLTVYHDIDTAEVQA